MVKRYTPVEGHYRPQMEEDEEGGWVFYGDYLEMLERNLVLGKHVEYLEATVAMMENKYT